MAHAVIERFQALESVFIEAVKRSERLSARFAAAAALDADSDVATTVRRALRERDALDACVSRWSHPSKPMRIVYGAALAAVNRDAGAYAETHAALKETRKARGGRRLSLDGSCTALTLTAAGGSPAQTGMFFDILEAIAAPWWRRDAAAEEAYAAIMAADGETPETAEARLGKARDAMLGAGVPKGQVNKAVYEVALADPSPMRFAKTWTALSIAARSEKGLVRHTGLSGLAILAAQVDDGSAAGDALVEANTAIRALKPKPQGMAAGRLVLRLAVAMTGRKTPGAAARDLSAIFAAQQAAVVAATAGVVAVTAAG
ncbi:hypothetical protein [Hyphobacterium marinum]|uniref:Uncharacterized protein n=1 Tax=Hyphobacterium marinum TaxID=3116574 RepID=A0ABU7LWH8_9PROT|nr:hypothetical protein [Hyphobacterium sp. Y6023]MEE2565903.1 hypothetical protein [Hyphobacterium sp. Y6023]